MRTSTPVIVALAVMAALYVKRLRTPAPDPRGPSRYDWTAADVSSAIEEARARGIEEHSRTHRYALMLNPGIRGTRCPICQEFYP